MVNIQPLAVRELECDDFASSLAVCPRDFRALGFHAAPEMSSVSKGGFNRLTTANIDSSAQPGYLRISANLMKTLGLNEFDFAALEGGRDILAVRKFVSKRALQFIDSGVGLGW